MRFIRSSLASGLLGEKEPDLPPIVQAGSLVLRARAAEVDASAIDGPEMQKLVQTMIEVMRKAPGVGLAAPQIGIGLRVIVLEDPADYQKKLDPNERRELERTPLPLHVFFNPVLRHVGETRATFFEGCLSVSGFSALVERSLEVEVSGLDESGKPKTLAVRGWPARILQHECDHLDGTLYIDRMLTRSFSAQENMKASFGGKSVAEVRRILGI